MSDFSHLDDQGHPRMVAVSTKTPTLRTALARSIVALPPAVFAALEANGFTGKKGSLFQTAILAGIMGAKQTGHLIPLCHPIGLDHCDVTIQIDEQQRLVIECTASLVAKTGVEMEALTGASIAALTIYDMCKALSHDIRIVETRLISKTGGKRDFGFPPSSPKGGNAKLEE